MGLSDPDDAAVWKLDERSALVITTDFFTPVVDDPYAYGAIAAANSLSDVYAMGGRPFLALNLSAFPPDLPVEVLQEIVRGAAEKARQAGVVIAGGHTIQDKEPKFGLVVIGMVGMDEILTKRGAAPGDRLFLSKPIGYGVTTTAIKQQKASPEDIAEVVRWMTILNDQASSLAVEMGLKGGTDVTGFSLLGHAVEMARASRGRFRLDSHRIPVLDCAWRYAEMGTFPGGAFDNKHYYQADIRFPEGFHELQKMLLFDPQTSGGLLLCVPETKADEFTHKAHDRKIPFWEIGEVIEGQGIEVIA